MDRTYLCIDLKSFYASVECVTRGLDPLTTNLVVADVGRTEKTICLAVTPSLKAYGIPGRARLFEVIQKVEQINRQRKYNAPRHKLDCESYNAVELERNPSLALSYIAAPPRMAYYMEYSTQIYNIYLKYIAPEDIHVYSIDEVFIDLTHYLSTYKCTARELARMMIKDVLANTGITATAGIGTNMYLAKIAMDITAKKMPADENGVRIAELDEMSYRKELWTHKPLTDFWMLGMVLEGLAYFGIYRMIAPYSPRSAHNLRAGIFGYLMFGACGFHVPTCALVFLIKHGLAEELAARFAAYFLLPAFALFWIFFVVLEAAQIKAFAKGQTPCPKWCWVFSLPVGMLAAVLLGAIVNHPFANALSCAWIAFANLWMFGGLLAVMMKAGKGKN